VQFRYQAQNLREYLYVAVYNQVAKVSKNLRNMGYQ